MSTARPIPRDRQIVEVKRISSRPAPNVGGLTPELPRVRRRHDPSVALLLMSSVVFLVVGVATMSIVAWLAGVVSLVAAFSVDTRHERELREFRRSRDPNDLRRDHRNLAKDVRRITTPRPRARVETSEAVVTTHSLRGKAGGCGIRKEDPRFAAQFDRWEPNETGRLVATVTLFTLSLVLLVLASYAASAIVWLAGIGVRRARSAGVEEHQADSFQARPGTESTIQLRYRSEMADLFTDLAIDVGLRRHRQELVTAA